MNFSEKARSLINSLYTLGTHSQIDLAAELNTHQPAISIMLRRSKEAPLDPVVQLLVEQRDAAAARILAELKAELTAELKVRPDLTNSSIARRMREQFDAANAIDQ